MNDADRIRELEALLVEEQQARHALANRVIAIEQQRDVTAKKADAYRDQMLENAQRCDRLKRELGVLEARLRSEQDETARLRAELERRPAVLTGKPAPETWLTKAQRAAARGDEGALEMDGLIPPSKEGA